MALPFSPLLRSGADPLAHRRRHRFVPSIAESATCLEARTLLSAAAGVHHHAMVTRAHTARDLAATPAGRRLTDLYESTMHTAPTPQQLVKGVHQLRAGTPIQTLRRRLAAEARPRRIVLAGPAVDPTITASPAASFTGATSGSPGMSTLTSIAGIPVQMISVSMPATASLPGTSSTTVSGPLASATALRLNLLNAGNGLRTNLFNAGNGLRTNLFDTGNGLRTNLFDTGIALRTDFFNVGNGLRTNLFNVGNGLRTNLLNTGTTLRTDLFDVGNVLRTDLLNTGAALRARV